MEKLEGFLYGWETAGRTKTFPEGHFCPFREWLEAKYNLSGPAYSQTSIIQLVAGNDHDAFHLFFSEFENFRASHPEYAETTHNPSTQVRDKGRREKIETIRRMPGIFLGGTNVDRMRGFLDGDAYARREADPEVELYGDLDKLEEWLREEEGTNVTIRCEAWAKRFGGEDTSKAFYWLMDKLEKFENSRGMELSFTEGEDGW